MKKQTLIGFLMLTSVAVSAETYVKLNGVMAALGYSWQLKKWLFEVTFGWGFQKSIYEGFSMITWERDDIYQGEYNGSTEWIPFKGGLMIGYRF